MEGIHQSHAEGEITAFLCIKQLQSSNPRLVQIHAGILLGSDAFESGITSVRLRQKML